MHKFELYTVSWGAVALVLATHGRMAWGYFTTGDIWMLDSQALWVLVLLVALNASATFLKRPYASVTLLFGAATWATALSLIPRHFWWQFPVLRRDLPDWLLIAAGVLLGAALITRLAMWRRWLGTVRGHGYQWITDWGRDKPYYARLVVRRVLHSLGYEA